MARNSSNSALVLTYDMQKRQIEANAKQDDLEALTTLLLTDKDNSKEILIALALCVAAIIIVINI